MKEIDFVTVKGNCNERFNKSKELINKLLKTK